MRVLRTGLTPLKGSRHLGLPCVDLTLDGPVGDRVFCLVDRERAQVLRTVENASLLQARVGYSGGVLSAELPSGTVSGTPAPTGESVKVDYWGRTAAVDVHAGPWADAFAAHLGRAPGSLVLGRVAAPGEVVYGASVSLVTTASLADLSERAGADVPDVQLRATFTIETDTPYVEDGWAGRRIALGEAEVEVRGPIPRCVVIDLDPETGARRTYALSALADYRRRESDVYFGVDAVVTRPGRVTVGDPVVARQREQS